LEHIAANGITGRRHEEMKLSEIVAVASRHGKPANAPGAGDIFDSWFNPDSRVQLGLSPPHWLWPRLAPGPFFVGAAGS
jgi:hypothetical protein